MTTRDVIRLSADELRELFLFESLDDEQLDWLSERAGRGAGARRQVYREGEPATCFFVLLAGTISMQRRVENTDVEISRTDQVGVYAGATQAFMPGEDPVYLNSVLAVTDCRFWVIAADEFGAKIRAWFPMATHLLEGLTIGMRSSQAAVGQRERLLSLGRLSAGLTHELNNPAAAAVRATAALRERVSRMRGKLAHLASGKVDAGGAAGAVRGAGGGAGADGQGRGDVADGGGRRRGRDRGLAGRPRRRRTAGTSRPALVAAGVDPDWLDEVADQGARS